jgi:hypothetical protein
MMLPATVKDAPCPPAPVPPVVPPAGSFTPLQPDISKAPKLKRARVNFLLETMFSSSDHYFRNCGRRSTACSR